MEKHLQAAETATQDKKAKGQLTAAAGQLASSSHGALRGALLDLAATYLAAGGGRHDREGRPRGTPPALYAPVR